MSTPQRLRFRRIGGYRLPAEARLVVRPSRFGNPFRICDAAWYAAGDPAQVVVAAFEDWLFRRRWTDWYLDEWLRLRPGLVELRGRDLACYCALDQPCHVDVLLRVVNSPSSSWPRETP